MNGKVFMKVFCLLMFALGLFPEDAFCAAPFIYTSSRPEKKQFDFNFPTGVAVAGGRIFVADRNNNCVKGIQFLGSITLVDKWGAACGGQGDFEYPSAIATGNDEDIYIADSLNNRILRWSAFGSELGKWGQAGSADGEFSNPSGVAVDGSGNVYVADKWNNRIQKFGSDGTFIKKWGAAGTGDGLFNNPNGIAIGGNGDVYVADSGNNRIQKFSPDGTFKSKWGTAGTDNGSFKHPSGVAVDSSGNIYVADSGNSRIQKFGPDGTFVLKWGGAGSDDGQFYYPTGVTIDSDGAIFVADSWNNRIQKFSAAGAFVAGLSSYGTANGYFNKPRGIATDGSGNVYVVDSLNNRIQKFDPDGEFISKWGAAGSVDGQFLWPAGIAINKSGGVYVVDSLNSRIQKFTSGGVYVSKIGAFGSADGQFDFPFGIAISDSGNIYVADRGNNRIQKFNSAGSFVLKWGGAGQADGQLIDPSGIAVDSSGNVYVSDTGNNRLQKFDPDGVFLAKWGLFGTGNGQFNGPSGITIDGAGNVFVADSDNHRIQEFGPDGSFVAGFGMEGSADSVSNGVTAFFKYPWDVALSPKGDSLYVADTENNRIQKFDDHTGIALRSPTSADSWAIDSTEKIRWSYQGAPSPFIQIELWKGGIKKKQISMGSLGSGGIGSYDWTVPSDLQPGNDYQIKVITLDTVYSGISGKFSITAPAGIRLGVVKLGTGTGTVTSSPAGINCASSCTDTSAYYPASQVVKLTAAPDAGSTFLGWGGNCSGKDAEATITMDAAKDCWAIFYSSTPGSNYPFVTVVKMGTGSGTVTSSPAGISCGSSCNIGFSMFLDPTDPTKTMTVTLDAAADPGSVFTGWDGDCTGAGSPVQVTTAAERFCIAAFDLVTVYPNIRVGGVVLKEEFGAGIPAGWTNADAWTIDNTACPRTLAGPFGAPWAIADSSCLTTTTEALTTSAFNTAGCTGAELAFTSQSVWNGGSGAVDVSPDNGSTWTTALNLTADEGPVWKKQAINGLAGVANGKVRFVYSNNTAAGYWALDNLWVSCSPAALKFIADGQLRTVYVENTGGANLTIGQAAISGTDAANFAVASDLCSNRTLLPGDACTIDVRFTTAAAVAKRGSLDIPSNDPDTPTASATLTGVKIQTGDTDGNGTMNIVDALFIARYAAGLSVGTFYPEAADVNCDGTVNIVDALFIARKAAGLGVTGWCGP